MKTLIVALFALFFIPLPLSACTNVLVTKGASADGSVMITYTADSAGFCPRLAVFPAATHPEGTFIEVSATKDRPAGKIKQAPQTYHVIGVTWEPDPNSPGGDWTRQGFINEHQLAITETTFGGRDESVNPQGLINYPMLITFALERAKTAREAIDVMVKLVEKYGYCDVGESISIADKNEAWVFEIVGTGPHPNPPPKGGGDVVIPSPPGEGDVVIPSPPGEGDVVIPSPPGEGDVVIPSPHGEGTLGSPPSNGERGQTADQVPLNSIPPQMILGTTPHGGAIWVAKKVPDGEISVHANQARIGEIPDVPNKDECFYADNIKTFAVKSGWYNLQSGKPFRFDDVYDVITPASRRVCATRVWSVFRRAAPSQNFSPDYHRGKPDAEPYPWSIKPDRKLTVADVLALKRDHYEGTEFDMTQGVDAGEYGLPLRWRPLYWEVDGDDNEYAWERPIATQQTGFSVVTQSRSNLPDGVGGVAWFGMDDCYLNAHFPVYCIATAIPEAFAKGSITHFSWDSAWWVFNLTANYANLKYSRITPEIIAVQEELESYFFMMQKPMEENIAAAGRKDPVEAHRFLTNYSMSQGELVFARWKKLAEDIFTKYNDGYIRSAEGTYPSEGDPYPEAWLRRVLKERPEQFKVPK